MKGVQAWAVGKRELGMGGALAAVSVCRLQHHKGGEEDTNEEQEFLDCHFLAIGRSKHVKETLKWCCIYSLCPDLPCVLIFLRFSELPCVLECVADFFPLCPPTS
jgi:hypothetical protein